MLVRRAEDGEGFTFHPLLREFLLERLAEERGEEERRRLHAAVAPAIAEAGRSDRGDRALDRGGALARGGGGDRAGGPGARPDLGRPDASAGSRCFPPTRGSCRRFDRCRASSRGGRGTIRARPRSFARRSDGFERAPGSASRVAGALRARRLALLDRGVRRARRARRWLESHRRARGRRAGARDGDLRRRRLRDDRPLRGVRSTGGRGACASRRRSPPPGRGPPARLPRHAAGPPRRGARGSDGGRAGARAVRPLQPAALLPLHARVHVRRARPHRRGASHLEASARGGARREAVPSSSTRPTPGARSSTPSRDAWPRPRPSSPTTRAARWAGRPASEISPRRPWRRCVATSIETVDHGERALDVVSAGPGRVHPPDRGRARPGLRRRGARRTARERCWRARCRSSTRPSRGRADASSGGACSRCAPGSATSRATVEGADADLALFWEEAGKTLPHTLRREWRRLRPVIWAALERGSLRARGDDRGDRRRIPGGPAAGRLPRPSRARRCGRAALGAGHQVG